MRQKGKYHSYHDLAAQVNARYRIEYAARGSKIVILTPHGGGIEPGTSEMVKALAGSEFSYYCFEGVKIDGNEELHVTSTRFDEPLGQQIAADAEMVLAVHGCGAKQKIIFIGGLHEQQISQFLNAFQGAGFSAERGYGRISGVSPRNICNRGRMRKGVQIEVSEGLRRVMFRGLDREGRKHTTAVFERFISVGREVLLRSQ